MLAKVNRLRLKKDYDQVFRKGQRNFSPFFNLNIIATYWPESRFGLIISNNISKKSTQRNLLKRRLRAIIRKNYPFLKGQSDVSISAKPAALVLNYADLEKELLLLFRKSGLLR